MENQTNTELNNSSSKVLVVEDDLLQQAVVCHILQTLGYQVEMADEGLKAAKLAKENHYDFILLDFSLPDIKGSEVVRLIRKDEAKYLRIPCPIALFTASLGVEQQKDCLAAGVNWVFEKPLTTQIMAQIEGHLKRV